MTGREYEDAEVARLVHDRWGLSARLNHVVDHAGSYALVYTPGRAFRPYQVLNLETGLDSGRFDDETAARAVLGERAGET